MLFGSCCDVHASSVASDLLDSVVYKLNRRNIVFFSGDIFKEKLSRKLAETTAKHTVAASSDTATTSASATTEVVDIFDDPLNASDV